MLAAGDTFRAAAIEQLKSGASASARRSSPARRAPTPRALPSTRSRRPRRAAPTCSIIDTAGRLQNKAGLMAELEKIVRVMKKVDPARRTPRCSCSTPPSGQNALSQVELFRNVAGVTGLVMTKLDGTARGGILVALAAKFGLPVHFIGVGEGVEDLEPFAARDFARAIAGLENG